MTTTTVAVAGPPIGSCEALAESFRRSLLAGNRAPRTVELYVADVQRLASFLAARGMPQAVAHIKREHVEAFVEDQLARHKPATASMRFKSLQQFFKWAEEEGEVRTSPMIRMRPAVPEEPVPVLTEQQLLTLLKTCAGKTFRDRRDTAVILLLFDTGMRRGELAGLRVVDIDWERTSYGQLQ